MQYKVETMVRVILDYQNCSVFSTLFSFLTLVAGVASVAGVAGVAGAADACMYSACRYIYCHRR